MTRIAIIVAVVLATLAAASVGALAMAADSTEGNFPPAPAWAASMSAA